MKCDSTKILAVLLLLLPSLGMAAEQAMGRLFFTPEQRARMDVARQHERSIRIETEQQENEPPAANITLNGMIARSDGKTTVWINNKEQSGEKVGSGIAVPGRGKAVGQVSVITSDMKRAIPLKVGQSIDMSSGRVEDTYRRTPTAPVPGKENTSTTTPSTGKAPVPAGSKDNTSADVQGETPLPR